MKHEVTVFIRSEQTDAAGQTERLEETAIGAFLRKGGKGYLSYEEQREGEHPSKVILKTDGDTVLMMRHGALPARLLFEKGKKHTGVYHTPYGALYLTTDTHRLRVREEARGEVRLHYTLLMDEDPLLHTTLQVSWKER